MLINVAFVVAVAVSLFLLQYVRRAVPRRDGTPPRTVLFARGLLELTVPFAIAAGVFAALQFHLARMTATSATTTIGHIESVLAELRTVYAKELNPPAWLQLACILILFAGGLVWPQVRAAMLMQKFKAVTHWLTRAYVLVTLLASFTFFGGKHLDGVAAAEARLVTEAAEIRLGYAEVYREVEDTMRRAALAAAIDHPDVSVHADKAAGVVRDAKRERVELDLTRAEVERVSKSEVKDFHVEPFAENSRPRAPRSGSRAKQQRPVVAESEWSRAGVADALREVKEARSAAGLDRPELTIVTESAVDSLHDHGGKALLAALFADGPIRSLLEIAIDPAVLHNFRDVIAAKVNEAWREIAAGRNPKEVIAQKAAAMRAQVSVLAQRSAGAVEQALRSAGSTWRARADDAAVKHAAVSRELNQKADAQYRREAARVAKLYRATYRFRDANITAAAGHLLDVVLQEVRAKQDPLDRVAALRNLNEQLALSSAKANDVDAVVRLVKFEEKRGEFRPFHAALSPALHDVMRTHDETQWGQLRTAAHEEFKQKSDGEGIALHEIAHRWEAAKERMAIRAALEGRTLTSDAWERAFYRHCLADAEAAVIWGWVVKDTQTVEVAAAYNDVIPRNGFRRYLEMTGQGSEATAMAVFSTPVALRAIDKFCKPKGTSSSTASTMPPWPYPTTGRPRPRPRPLPRRVGR